MKYIIYNKLTEKIESDSHIVTQDGEIAHWDDSQGWSTDLINQEDYEIYVEIK